MREFKTTEKKTIYEEVTKYEAEDGLVFDTKEECEKYEASKRSIEDLEKYEIEEADDLPPIFFGELDAEYWYYRWYKVENEKVFEEIKEVFTEAYDLKIDKFSTIICAETQYNDGSGDVNMYSMDYVKEKITKFMNVFNIDISYTEK